MWRIATIMFGVLVLTGLTVAQEEADAPPEQQRQPAVEADGISATVVSVSGRAQKLTADTDAEWQDLAVGEQLSGMTVVRTGLGSKVVLKLADHGEVTIDRATKMGIAELSKEGNAARARLGLKYGRVRAEVETSAGPTDMQIQTAAATLSVRGSGANVAHMGMNTRASSYRGSWGLFSPAGFTVLSAGQGGDNQMTPWQTTNTKGTQPGLLGQLHGLSGGEKNFLLFNGSGRSLPGFLSPFGNPSGLFNLDGRGGYLEDHYEGHQEVIENGFMGMEQY